MEEYPPRKRSSHSGTKQIAFNALGQSVVHMFYALHSDCYYGC